MSATDFGAMFAVKLLAILFGFGLLISAVDEIKKIRRALEKIANSE